MVNEGDNENKVDDSRAAVAADVHTIQSLNFSKMHIKQQEAISNMAKEIYTSYMPTNWFNNLSCYKKVEVEYKEVTAFTVYMLEYIKENCKNSRNIFRVEEECEDFEYNVRKLSYDSFFPYLTYTPSENASFIKGYLNRGLNGLIQFDIATVLCNAFKNSKRDFEELISWFPFVINTNEYRFFTEAIEMFKEIDRHHENTLMTFTSLVHEFVPLLFPKEIYKNYPDVDFKKLAERIFSCDFNKVPPIDYEKIKDLGKEVVKQTVKKNIKNKW
jgi:hypothetical protein